MRGGAGPLCAGPGPVQHRRPDSSGPARAQNSPAPAPEFLLPAGNGFIREWKRASRRAHFVSPSVCVDAAAVGVCGLCTYMALIITHKAL